MVPGFASGLLWGHLTAGQSGTLRQGLLDPLLIDDEPLLIDDEQDLEDAERRQLGEPAKLGMACENLEGAEANGGTGCRLFFIRSDRKAQPSSTITQSQQLSYCTAHAAIIQMVRGFGVSEYVRITIQVSRTLHVIRVLRKVHIPQKVKM